MRKQEYIHVHALLVEVTRHLTDHEDMPAEIRGTYNTLDIHPSSVHASKQDHHEAVMALATAIGTWLELAPDERADLTVTLH
ncbi:UPF0058 family protein [Halosimplex amylolyticum]|uniref:UPF0058 family protein n=1 Tax=Halosimplex amylolyticum TaxID=3396616 RepID=UPI003F56AC89